MSATTLAPVIVKAVRCEPSVINAEEVVRNILIEFEKEVSLRVAINTVKDLKEDK
jgi:hypothetical protein